MFRSATIRLTVLYVAILAVICLFFSVNLYRVSTNELDRGLGRQMMMFQQNPQFQNFFGDDYAQSRDDQLSEARRHIIINLVDVDILILVIGGIGCYFLARRTLKPIQEAHDAQVRFTADASHELRTPLAAMKAEIEVALRDPKFDKKEAKGLLESNLEELDKLTVLSNDLLSLARNGEKGEIVLVDLSTVIGGAMQNTKTSADTKKITLNASPTNLKVLGDAQGLTQLLTVLVDNAIKYSEPSTTVTLKAAKRDDEVLLSVTDQGIGIDPGDLSRIFDRFYRADSSRSKQDSAGYGLGLSIAKKIAESNYALITVKSKKGAGSNFTVRLKSA